ncbi:S8 family peptidase [Tumebacillus flagellatus]|uniref:Peptidase S8/S53 domain-containing protein n=1 Tax=Tumebacillus flagellatus TaxID=1157490 RepID=A0A074LKQ8_9BACL|nr:S8 family serine peptidase [Tumebacillus flagellatus]KEO81684.1 hypothetical protein EL26_19630 [Tumebacillus flagellatus]
MRQLTNKKKWGFIIPIFLLSASCCIYAWGEVTENSSFYFHTITENKWALEMIGADKIRVSVGQNNLYHVKVGILDTGIAGEYDNLNLKRVGGNKDNGLHTEYHGVTIAGIIGAKRTQDLDYQGLLPGISLYTYNVSNESLDNKQLANGIKAFLQNGVDVLNISLGGFKADEEVLINLKKVIANGTVVVASSGNSGTSDYNYPASYSLPGLLSVGSLDKNNNILPFTTVNDKVDLYVPGQDIYSLMVLGSKVSCMPYSGTSVSVPYVTSVVAMIRALEPSMSPKDIKRILIENSDHRTVYWKNQKRTVRVMNVEKVLTAMGVEINKK